MHTLRQIRLCRVVLVLVMFVCASIVLVSDSLHAQTKSGKGPRRAAPPNFAAGDAKDIFFDKFSDAVTKDRPPLGKRTAVAKAAATDNAGGSADDKSAWTERVSPASLEDEVKRVRLRFDAAVSTPSAFRSGGYQDARVDLTILSTLFAVIHEYDGDVRWKKDAAAARDLMGRSARNAQAGTIQVFNEVKQRQADLQDLMSGSGLNARDLDDAKDWSMIADRVPLMTYAEQLLDGLGAASRDEATIQSEADKATRLTEMLGMIGVVIANAGMDEADDDDYAALAAEMARASFATRDAVRREDWAAIGGLVGAVTQSCTNCHEQYR